MIFLIYLNGSLFYSKEKQEVKKKIEFLPRIFSVYRNMGNRATLKRKKKEKIDKVSIENIISAEILKSRRHLLYFITGPYH